MAEGHLMMKGKKNLEAVRLMEMGTATSIQTFG
jgi:hypothetical protein